MTTKHRVTLSIVGMLLCGRVAFAQTDLLTYVLSSPIQVTTGFQVDCNPPGYNCAWNNNAAFTRTYATDPSHYTLIKSYYSPNWHEDYSAGTRWIMLLDEWNTSSNNTFFQGGIHWLPRYLNIGAYVSWYDNQTACTNSLSCTSCVAGGSEQVTGFTGVYYNLRLWNENITPNGPAYILTRHNQWGSSYQYHELYYYGLNQGFLGYEYWVPGNCATGEYWLGDSQSPANTQLCLVQRGYVTALHPDNGVLKNCN